MIIIINFKGATHEHVLDIEKEFSSKNICVTPLEELYEPSSYFSTIQQLLYHLETIKERF